MMKQLTTPKRAAVKPSACARQPPSLEHAKSNDEAKAVAVHVHEGTHRFEACYCWQTHCIAEKTKHKTAKVEMLRDKVTTQSVNDISTYERKIMIKKLINDEAILS